MQEGGLWPDASALAVAVGSVTEAITYTKSASLHLWLLGYEFTETILVFTKSELHAMAGPKKTDILAQLSDACAAAGVTLRLHPKPKKEDGSTQIEALLAACKASADTPVIGTLPKEKPQGAVPEAWLAAVAGSGLATSDMAADLAALLSPKDDEEAKNVRKAAYLVSNALTKFAVPQLEGIIDEEKKVRHSKLADKIEEVISEPSKMEIKLKADSVDIAYPPLVQSGGDYDLRLASASKDTHIHYGVIVCSLGARYASYCANVARTYFVDPSKQQEAEYAALQEAQAAAVAALVEGAPMSAAYEAVVETLKAKGQDALVDKLTKNVGTAIGLELRDTTQQLNTSNSKPVKAGMTFNVAVGVSGLMREDAESDAGKSYAMLVADTVVCKPGGAPPDVATTLAPKDWKEVAYYLKDGGEDEAEVVEVEDDVAALAEVGMRKSARTEHVDFKAREEERRRQKENQEDLLQRVNQATLDMLSKGGAGGGAGSGVGRKITDIQAYRSVTDMQHNNSLTVQVDHRAECVLVPIYGQLVPFHILTVRNASNNQDGEHAYIRLNFNFSGAYEPCAKHPQAAILKELSFRSSDIRHAAKVVQEIKALRSAVMQRDKERAERATLVQQEKLVRGKGRVYALPDVWIRPAFGGKGRKVTGTLEAHFNGFRYTSPKGEELDIMYRNIKHAFFQPADNEMIALVHFHLVNPIMVGKKKTNDVQFYTEVMDSVQTLDAGRRSMYDPDEIEEEQRERERRNQINRQFNQFVKRVQQDIWERDYGDLNLEFEVPFRELGFHGVPHRTNSFIMPTVNCLVELTEMPFTVITLGEVNLVNLERVGFNLRNFDMVFIWKDLNRDDWLTSIEIKYYESKVNLNWKNILKSIKEDPEGFIEDGGWSFLDAEQSDSEEEGDEEESDFAPSDAGGESEEDASSEDASMVSEGEEESEYEAESDEEAGLDWDELEEQAAAEDRERSFSDDGGNEEFARKRKSKGGGGGGGKKPRR
ncbi:hypothetical protein CHLNCDRAFT_140286 [Chlorella variabilis]|uniref:FACT complex subunit n=1 Tax=Chlorella variabilis TaxID=554065 RepID=E1Z6P2_CHLVA|nr:hypothetical protein CHLNCDRAFT_140286 [Chlorella variabilis]EFN58683.1 hypothetical protein CHLNCDRAFT_140286 [Chlorella variabilis]|eukprot:XP_005850785.1 hypothetical protein CHLNCDRAFT_140286 [Chlorella variabilis]